MFDTSKAYCGFAAPDIDQARAFYGDTLGMDTAIDDRMGFLTLTAGDREIYVYPKPDHQPANFTILNFPVDDVEAAVDELTAKGVQMQRYDGFEHDERGIVNDQGFGIAWFTDPAGNILSVHTAM